MDQIDAQTGPEEIEENNEEAITDELSMESLLAQGDFSLDMPKSGEIREGVIASISDDEILVSIGAKSEGVIPSREFAQLPEETKANLKTGQDIQVYVISPESRQGTMLLSIVRALEEEDWESAEDLMKGEDTYEGQVDGFNKGGLIVNLGHLRGFVPASQISVRRRMGYSGDTPDEKWGGMIGEPIAVRVIEVDRQRRRLILSEKAASQEKLKDRLMEELEVGLSRTGRVTSLADFGAFVNINGADGLVHLSELSWERVSHPKEVLEVGQEVTVKIISLDRDRKRIGLSIRQLENDPWDQQVEKYKVGQLIEGTITRLTKFGAFARIDDNLEGLIHISELSDRRIEHPKEVVSESDVITLRIIKIDGERRRIGLSLRKVESMQYSEMDWELALADIEDMDEVSEKDQESEEEVLAEAASEEPTEDASPTADAETEDEAGDDAAAAKVEAEDEAGDDAPAAKAETEDEAGDDTPAAEVETGDEAGDDAPAAEVEAEDDAGDDTPAAEVETEDEADDDTPAAEADTEDEAGDDAPAAEVNTEETGAEQEE